MDDESERGKTKHYTRKDMGIGAQAQFVECGGEGSLKNGVYRKVKNRVNDGIIGM